MKTALCILFLFLSNILFASGSTIYGIISDKLSGELLIGANIVIEGSTWGTATNYKGKFRIVNVPPGKYILRASYIGYTTIKKEIIVKSNDSLKVDFALVPETIEGSAVTIIAERPQMEKSNRTSSTIVSNQLIQVQPFDDLNLGRNYSNTEEYNFVEENDFLSVIKNPLSTFSIDVDAASYSNTRRFLTNSQLPPVDAVRVEEFINYFSYNYPLPAGKVPLAVYTELSECPWNKDNYLVHIGIKGKELKKEEQHVSNLVFLIDVSGSMQPENKLPLLKKSFQLLVKNLNENDKISIVVYAGAAGLILPSTFGSEREKILNAIENLQAGGSTAGGAGIKLAYKIAEENFIEKGNNRVILATDGDFNVGVSSTSELVRLLEDKRDEGIYLTVLGFGMGNYKDGRLEQLADKGNGNYYYIDNLMEGKKVLVNELTSTLFTIAKDVKIQVEFNPAKVKSYRLVGYENRKLNKEDFENDKKDAGEIGSGHTVTALYEIVPAAGNEELESNDLKYQETNVKKEAEKSDELLTIKVRYKYPDEDKSQLISKVIKNNDKRFLSSSNFKFSAAAAQFAMLLRDSKFKGNSSYTDAKELAKQSLGEDRFGYRNEFLHLLNIAEMLASSIVGSSK